MYKAIPVLIVFALLTACGSPEDSVPSQYLQFDTMVQIVADIQVVEAKANLSRSGSMVEENKAVIKTDYEQVFFNYHTTQARFDSSYNYYARRPKMLDKVFEKAIEELNRRNTEALK